MPCGGIYPISSGLGFITKEPGPDVRCWQCNEVLDKGCPANHFIDEWDAYIHPRCVAAFLATEEGQCLIAHGHNVIIQFGGEPL